MVGALSKTGWLSHCISEARRFAACDSTFHESTIMHLPRRTLLPLLFSALAMVGCSENPTEPNNDLPYTISGTLVDRTSKPVPGSTRVVVAWVVSSGSPDYTYVYGEGTLQEQVGTFSLTFDAPPPAAALNSSGCSASQPFGQFGST